MSIHGLIRCSDDKTDDCLIDTESVASSDDNDDNAEKSADTGSAAKSGARLY